MFMVHDRKASLFEAVAARINFILIKPVQPYQSPGLYPGPLSSLYRQWSRNVINKSFLTGLRTKKIPPKGGINNFISKIRI